ncbi:MAG: hypothetical protein FVQ80_04760 [Planctomycetes bacterium]|nr:hypothetical protein [Planctomycetota bacterium]
MRTITFPAIVIVCLITTSAYCSLETGLIGHWRLDETSGTIANDSNGTNHGTLVNGPIWTSGILGGALNFDGTNDYVALPDNNPIWLPQNDFTVSAWVYFERDSVREFILDLNHGMSSAGTNRAGYGLERLGTGSIRFDMIINDSEETLDSSTILAKDTWYHIVAVRNGTAQQIYIDGVLDNSRTCLAGPVDFVGGYDDGNVQIGRYTRTGGPAGGNFLFDGSIDNVRIYDRALSGPEVQQLYMEISFPAISLSSSSFSFTADQGGANPTDQVLSIHNGGPNTINWDITYDCNWLTVSPLSGESSGPSEVNDVTLSVDITSLVGGTYNCTLTISDPCAFNNPQTVNVSLFVQGPEITLSSTSFEFVAGIGAKNPAIQTLGISNSGSVILNWIASEPCNWLSVSPATGSSTGEIDITTLSVDISGLAPGDHSCTLTISDPCASNNPQTVSVTLHIMDTSLPVSLYYDAQTYAYAWAQNPMSGGIDTDTDNDSSIHSKCTSLAYAYSLYEWYCAEFLRTPVWQRSYLQNSVEGISNSNTASVISTLHGWGNWESENICTSSRTSGNGGGDGDGYTSLTGQIAIGILDGFPANISGPVLTINASIIGDLPGQWNSWNWWFKIWDDDPNNPLVTLNGSNTTASLDVITGEILNIEFYHEAGQIVWPAAGLNSTVQINMELEMPPMPDPYRDWFCDLRDVAVLANDWPLCLDPCDPNFLPGDVTQDYCVDYYDAYWMFQSWLNCFVTAASNPDPYDNDGFVDPNAILSWTTIDNTIAHDLYIGTNSTAVADANLFSPEYIGTVNEPNFDPGPMDLDIEYFWRIDEVGPKCLVKGSVWSFIIAVDDPNLIALWRLDESSGTTANDSSSGNHGTVNGARWTTGQVGGALDFDGVNDYVSLGNPANLNFTGQITISVWIRPDLIPDDPSVLNIVAHGFAGSPTKEVYLRINNGMYQIGSYIEGSLNILSYYNIPAVDDGNWVHLVGLHDGSKWMLYRNGVEVSSTTTEPGAVTVDGDWAIGARGTGTGRFFDGKIDDVRIYDRPLSGLEIEQIYDNGISP